MKLGDLKVEVNSSRNWPAMARPRAGEAAARPAPSGPPCRHGGGGLTLGKKKYEDAWQSMAGSGNEADGLSQKAVVADRSGYGRLQRGGGGHAASAEIEIEKSVRRQAIEAATLQAAEVPLKTLKEVAQAVELVRLAADGEIRIASPMRGWPATCSGRPPWSGL